jgi:hypothetical protein
MESEEGGAQNKYMERRAIVQKNGKIKTIIIFFAVILKRTSHC